MRIELGNIKLRLLFSGESRDDADAYFKLLHWSFELSQPKETI